MSDPKSRQVFEDGANELEKFEERSDEKVAERLYLLFKLINSCEAIEYNDGIYPDLEILRVEPTGGTPQNFRAGGSSFSEKF